jgi:hypothetical protein
VNDDEVLAFVHTDVGSVWAIELLIFLKGHSERAWEIKDLVLALRSSSMAVAQAMTRLQAAGFVSEKSPGSYSFEPRSSRHLEMATAIEKLSAQKPMTLARAIAEIPNEKLRNFADAFKLRE